MRGPRFWIVLSLGLVALLAAGWFALGGGAAAAAPAGTFSMGFTGRSVPDEDPQCAGAGTWIADQKVTVSNISQTAYEVEPDVSAASSGFDVRPSATDQARKWVHPNRSADFYFEFLDSGDPPDTGDRETITIVVDGDTHTSSVSIYCD